MKLAKRASNLRCHVSEAHSANYLARSHVVPDGGGHGKECRSHYDASTGCLREK